jgi:hypothetical protein
MQKKETPPQKKTTNYTDLATKFDWEREPSKPESEDGLTVPTGILDGIKKNQKKKLWGITFKHCIG